MRRLLGLTVLMMSFAATNAQAYVATTTQSGAEIRWEAYSAIPWYIDASTLPADVDLPGARQAVQAAFDTWTGVSCASMQSSYAGTTTEPTPGAILVRFEMLAWDGVPMGLARTEVAADDMTGQVDGVVIELNGSDYAWTVTGQGDRQDLSACLLGQVGAALGLGTSRDRSAAMFFGGATLATGSGLADDDRRGVCYLYPTTTFADGLACDSCALDKECASGTCTFRAADGASFCATLCGDAAQCGAGTSCQAGTCVPTYGSCLAQGKTAPAGAFCWGNEICSEGLLCRVGVDSAHCASQCVTDLECAQGTCIEGLCTQPGSGSLGSVCMAHADCASTDCMGAPQLGYCTTTCEDTCAAGLTCLALGGGSKRCIQAGAAGTGEACMGDIDCQSLLCRDLGRPRGMECTARCDEDACAPGSECFVLGEEQLCVSPGRVALGGACVAPLGSLLCDTLECADFGTGPVCTRPCDGACPGGCSCHETTGLCAPPTALGMAPGAELCDGADQNCNGAADEGFQVGSNCALEDTSCTLGVVACSADGQVSECVQAVDCDDADACSVGACDGLGGCTFSALVCQDDNPCTIDACDPSIGCVHTPRAEGETCSDGNSCTVQAACMQGLCQATEIMACKDGNACTTDMCSGGVCVHQQRPGCGVELCGGIVCNDANPCTIDTCDGGECIFSSAADGASCNDGDVCNGFESCSGGICRNSSPLNCDDGVACTLDICHAVLGCQNTLAPNGASCTDGNVCNGAETCEQGKCRPGTGLQCDDGKACTADLCDSRVGCITAVRQDGAPCGDGDACNGLETCLVGRCEANIQLNCDDGNVCTLDNCDPIQGCVSVPHEDGSPCPDGDVCNGTEACEDGECRSVEPLVCNDGNKCTVDLCDALVGCLTALQPNGANCSDGDHCNGAEKCHLGECLSAFTITPTAGVIDCDDGNTCTMDLCVPDVGCVNEPLPNGSACGASDPCAVSRLCQAGTCTETEPLDCNDGNPCTIDDCIAGKGCLNAVKMDCDDGNSCTNDTCDLISSGCLHSVREDGESCGDGNMCNGQELCYQGGCKAGKTVHCNDNDPCTLDSCDMSDGQCINVRIPGCLIPGTFEHVDFDSLDQLYEPIRNVLKPVYKPFSGDKMTFEMGQTDELGTGCTFSRGPTQSGLPMVLLMLMMAAGYSMMQRRRKSDDLVERIRRLLSYKGGRDE